MSNLKLRNRILSATVINGTKVLDIANENIGEIEDLMINLGTGKVEYAVLSFNETPGWMGKRSLLH